jgi:hypothetical protein
MRLMCVTRATATTFIAPETAKRRLVAASVEKNSRLQTAMLALRVILAIPTAVHANASQTERLEIIVRPLMGSAHARATLEATTAKSVHQASSTFPNANVS